MRLIEIENIKEYEYVGKVYDLEVIDDNSYNIEGIIVHNSDYVMVGSILNKSLESAGETVGANIHHESWLEPGEVVDQYSDNVKMAFKNGAKFYKKFRGMSTKGVQKMLGNENIKTSEGVTRMNPVEYTLEGWTENFKHYLASAMSYTGSKNLKEFIGKVDLVHITRHSFDRFNK